VIVLRREEAYLKVVTNHALDRDPAGLHPQILACRLVKDNLIVRVNGYSRHSAYDFIL
jgi:hypothetical protein